MNLQGRNVLVVGGAEGLGFAVARLFAGEGASVAIASRSLEKGTAAAASIPGASAHRVDLDDPDSIDMLLAEIGLFDHLIVTLRRRIAPQRVTELSLPDAIAAFHVKFWGSLALVQKAAPYLSAGGSITLTSGTAGLCAYPGQAVNSAINAATESLCRVLAVELAPVRVNVVSPGFIGDNSASDERYQSALKLTGRIPAGRLASSEEIARAFLFLAQSDYSTGSVLIVDGGSTC